MIVYLFCIELGFDDIWILICYNLNFFNEVFFGVMYEVGYGIYE